MEPLAVEINDWVRASNFLAPPSHAFMLTRCFVEVREMSMKQLLPIVLNLVSHANIKPATFDALPWRFNQLIQLAQIYLHINLSINLKHSTLFTQS